MMLAFDDNKVISTMQRNFDFSASFNAYYLVNPNNLLTHNADVYIINVRAYARVIHKI